VVTQRADDLQHLVRRNIATVVIDLVFVDRGGKLAAVWGQVTMRVAKLSPLGSCSRDQLRFTTIDKDRRLDRCDWFDGRDVRLRCVRH